MLYRAIIGLILAGLLLGAAPDQKDQSQLSIVNPALHQYEDGPPVPKEFSFLTGDVVFLTFEVRGYHVDDSKHLELQCQIAALDPNGVPVAEPIDRKVDTTLSAEDKNWMPTVRSDFQIPSLGLGGTYRIALSVVDKLSGKQAKLDLPLLVKGKHVEPSDTLVARNFRFLRSEEGGEVLQPAIYHSGNTLWARFDIIGFKYADRNGIRVSYGLSVLGPTGKNLYTEPNAALEQGESFYPKKYLSGILSLNLQKDAKPGEYTIVLLLKDEVGNQTAESKHVFRIE